MAESNAYLPMSYVDFLSCKQHRVQVSMADKKEEEI
jgi:hypothetical protein